MINNRIELTVENHIAHVKLSRAQKMNSLDSEMFDAIPMVGEQIRQDSSIRVVVISGDGGNFCAGLDKSNFSSMLEDSGVSIGENASAAGLAERTHGIANAAQYAAWMWRELPMPVIAAV
jgi:enoyl-CoA hydratase/carnithine racemase